MYNSLLDEPTFHLPKEWTIEEDDICRWHVHQGKTLFGTYMTEEKAINAVKVFTRLEEEEDWFLDDHLENMEEQE